MDRDLIEPEPPELEVNASGGTDTRQGLHLVLVHIVFTLAAAAGMWLLVASFVGTRVHWLQGLFIPASILLVIGLFILRNERHWVKPSRMLRTLLPKVRTGEVPIEELSQIGGGLERAGLIDEIRQVLRDLRQQRAEVAKLEEEMRQRLATRTSALERQIGTLRLQASRDALTGLYNRRMFEGFLERLVGQCQTEDIDLTVMMIDVDNFKTLNDTLGHSAGDELLRNIGQLIRSHVRDQDAPFRFGGDEFCIVLPGCSADSANKLGKRLAELVDGLARTMEVSQRPGLSIGIAAMSEVGSVPAQQAALHDQGRQKRRRPALGHRDSAAHPQERMSCAGQIPARTPGAIVG
jgi:diguanylate cyclase (GGDEF)-like protein